MKMLARMIILLSAIGLMGACSASPATPIPGAPTLTPTFTFALTDDQAKSLASLEKIDDHPLYVMEYYREYAQGPAPSLAALPAPPAAGQTPAACSLLAVLLDGDHRLYGRNFDWQYSPAVLLFTYPPDGYASVSMVDLTYLGLTDETARKLMDLPIEKRVALLSAPQIPFDGMNDQGLAIAMAAVPPGDMKEDPAKNRIGSLAIMREVLDHARNVGEAVDLFEQYNVHVGSQPIHYLIADANGEAVLIEFYEGEMHVFENEQPWHSATNFLRASVDDPKGQCWRYDKINDRLNETQGLLDSSSAMDLLADVSQGNTQWSVVYQMARGEVSVAMDKEYANVHTFRMSDYGHLK